MEGNGLSCDDSIDQIDNVADGGHILRLRTCEERLVTSASATDKVATRAIAAGEPIYRYGQIIGFASRPIVPAACPSACAIHEFARLRVLSGSGRRTCRRLRFRASR
jgi:hypothetical protein